MIQDIDYEKREIRVCDNDFTVSSDVMVKDLLRLDTDFTTLKAGTMVKVKGTYTPGVGLAPHLLKMKETFAYNIDKLKGDIEQVNADQKTFLINGYTVQVNAKTVIEGI